MNPLLTIVLLKHKGRLKSLFKGIVISEVEISHNLLQHSIYTKVQMEDVFTGTLKRSLPNPTFLLLPHCGSADSRFQLILFL